MKEIYATSVAFLILLLALPSAAYAQKGDDGKPIILISGEGLTDIQSTGTAGAAHGVGVATSTTQVSKRNAVMTLSRVLLKDCPSVKVTLDEAVAPDYYMSLNIVARGGFLIVSEFSQLMVADAKKSPIYSEQGSTSSLAKRACKAVLADWQAHEKKANSADKR